MLKVTEVKTGLRFEVKVQPRSSQNRIAGVVEGVLKIKLTSPPVEGKANQALINLLARFFAVPRRNITLVRGETSTNKLIEIKGIDKATLITKAGSD